MVQQSNLLQVVVAAQSVLADPCIAIGPLAILPGCHSLVIALLHLSLRCFFFSSRILTWKLQTSRLLGEFMYWNRGGILDFA